jgi:capsular polysaccharide transport system permease protein
LRRDAIDIFWAVQKALFFRELGMRMSIGHLGLFWTFVEPFMYVFIFVAVKIFLLGAVGERFDYAVFLTLSFTAFLMFKRIVTQSLGAFSANRGLFNYKQVKPIDTIVARVLVEVFVSSIVLVVFIAIGYYFGYDMQVQNVVMVALGYIWLVVFGFSLGLFLAVWYVYVESVKNMVTILMQVLMFVSALFYTLDMLSPQLREALLYNPLVHFMEMLHGHYFYTLDDQYVSYTYMILWTLVPAFSGLWLYRKSEKRIISE